MRAHAVVEVVRRGGRDVLLRTRSEPPLSVRRGHGVVHLVGSGAGPLGGDDLRLRVRVGAGARLELATVAASMVLPGVDGAVSSYELDAEVDEGGHLGFHPEPQVLVQGCDHEMRSTIRLADGATLSWRDETVLGRHDEPTGSLRHRVRVDRAGRPLLRSDLVVGPRWPDSLGPAGLAGAGAVGSLLLVGRHVGPPGPPALPAPAVEAARGEALELDADAVLVSAVGTSARAVRHRLGTAAPARRP